MNSPQKLESSTPVRPEDVLADHLDHTERNGLLLRKGTVAAFLQNAMRWSDPAVSESEREALTQEIAKSVPALRALGIFTVFELRDPQLRELLARY